jgi:hypothetical protein
MVQQSFISNAVSSAGSTTSPSAPRKWPGPSLGYAYGVLCDLFAIVACRRLQRHGANNYHYYFAQVQVQQEQEQIYQSVQEQRRTESQERLKAVEAALADEKAKSARLEAELKTALAANKLAPTPVLLSSSSPSPSQNREWAVVSADEERMVLSVLEQIDQIQPTSGWSYLYNRNKEICGVRYSGICFTEFNISAFVTDDLRFVEWFTLDNSMCELVLLVSHCVLSVQVYITDTSD